MLALEAAGSWRAFCAMAWRYESPLSCTSALSKEAREQAPLPLWPTGQDVNFY
jgi:hypothetical protein